MKPRTRFRLSGRARSGQHGVALFFALVSLVSIMLAAVALIRSVDTSTMIAGNLAFKQSATSSGDAGTEAALSWLSGVSNANSAKNVLTDTTHAFNITDATRGYYSNADTSSLFADTKWNAITAIAPVTDSSGNTMRYIIQRMCRTANVAIQNANCLFSGAIQDPNGKQIPLPQDICEGAGCPVAGQTPMLRVTTRVNGPKNTVSYVQAFIY